MEFPALVVGDLHLTEKNLSQFLIFADQVRDLSRLSVRSIIFVGDIFDSPDSVKWITVLTFYKFLSLLSGCNIYLLTGNHDRPLYGQYDSTLDIFKGIARVCTMPRDEDGILWLPYTDEDSARKHISTSKSKTCFSHQMIKGLILFSGNTTARGIDSAIYEKFEFSFNGHIHNPQVIPNSLYITGSPWQHTFAEAGQQKFLWYWDGKKVTPIKSQVPEQYLTGTFEELTLLDLTRKSIKVFLKPGEDPNVIANYLEAHGASRWILQQASATETVMTGSATLQSSLNDLLINFADARNLGPDETSLGLHFLEAK